MKLKELLKKINLPPVKNLHELPRPVKKIIENSTMGKELMRKTARLGCQLTDLLAQMEPAAILKPSAQLSSVVIDTSTQGFSSVIDGKERLAWFYLFVSTGRLSGEIDLPVMQLNCGHGVSADAPENGFLNVPAIRQFLLRHWKTEIPREEVISHFTRRIVRHLSAISNTGRHATESALLALELANYLPQTKVAEVMHRSEAWVSDACSLANLEAMYRQALEEGSLSYSAALILAQAANAEDRALLYELTQKQSVGIRSLRVAMQFLRQNEGFARKADALAKLLKLIEERLVNITGNYFARLKLIFRNRRPLWHVRFLHKKDKKQRGDILQTGAAADYRSLLARLREAERALASFPI